MLHCSLDDLSLFCIRRRRTLLRTTRYNLRKIPWSLLIDLFMQDATLSIDLLTSLPNCTGRIAATGMCLGGHLAFRVRTMSQGKISQSRSAERDYDPQAAFDPRVLSTVCFFATDIHGATLGRGGDDSLVRVNKGELTGKGEVVVCNRCLRAVIVRIPCLTSLNQMIFGKQDTHVPRAGRDLIRKSLEDANVTTSVSTYMSQQTTTRANTQNASSSKFKRNTHSFATSQVRDVGMPP